MARALWVIALCFFSVNVEAQNWPTTAGPYSRARSVDGVLATQELAPVWSLPSFGQPNHAMVADIDGDPEVEYLFVSGGRARAYRPDGTLEWLSSQADLLQAMPPVDLDGDGRPELIFRRSIAGFAVLSGIDGALLYRSNLEDLSQVGRILIRDLDGDGLSDLVVAEADCGSQTRNIGRTIAFRFAVPTAPVELFRLEEKSRDYNCGRALIVANVVGGDELEIVALGTTHAYVYSTTDGHLEATSSSLGSLPYGIAEIFAADLDNDLLDELIVMSNNSYGASINSRRALMVNQDATGELAVGWEASVADVVSDKHSWPSNCLVDLDGDGKLELAHSFYEYSTSTWTTYLRSATTGAVLATLPGQLAGISEWNAVASPWTIDLPTNRLLQYRLTNSGALATGAELVGDAFLLEMNGYDEHGYSRGHPLCSADGEFIATLDLLDAAEAKLETTSIISSTVAGTANHFVPASLGDVVVGSTDHSGSPWLGVINQEGEAAFLDRELSVNNLDANGASKVHLSRQLAVTSSLMLGADFPATSTTAGFDAKLATLTHVNLLNPAEVVTTDYTLLGLLIPSFDSRPVWVGLDGQYAEHIPDVVGFTPDRVEQWQLDGIVETTDATNTVYYRPSLSPDLNHDGTPDVLLQLGDYIHNVLSLLFVSGADGAQLWSFDASSTFTGSATGWPVGLAGLEGSAGFFLNGVLSFVNASTGLFRSTSTLRAVYDGFAVDLDDDGEDEMVSTAGVLPRWYAVRQDASIIWSQDSIYATKPKAYSGNGASYVRGLTGRFIVESRKARESFDHNFIVLNATTGAILHKLYLHDGTLSILDPTETALVSLSAGIGLSSVNAQYMVGDSDGFLYLINLDASSTDPAYPQNMLINTWSLGSPIGNLSGADIDQDGFVEIAVPIEDSIILFDTPRSVETIEVRDTDCFNQDVDVDQVERTDLFCGSWTSIDPVLEGFAVYLIEADTNARVAGPIGVSGTQTVRFDGVPLRLGERYKLSVQGYAGAGQTALSTPLFESDGAVVIDPQEPPIVELVAAPTEFVAGEAFTEIQLHLFDSTRLESYQLAIQNPQGLVVYQQGDPLNTASITITTTWFGLDDNGDPLPPGSYTIVASATDFTGLVGSDSTPVDLVLAVVEPELEELDEMEEALEEPEVLEELSDVAEPDVAEPDVAESDVDAMEDVTEDATAEDSAESADLMDAAEELEMPEEWVIACGCRSVEAKPHSPLAAVLLLLGLLVPVLRQRHATRRLRSPKSQP